MDTYCGARSSRPAVLFSFSLLNGLQGVRLRRPHLREAPADFGLGRFATAFLNNPGLTWPAVQLIKLQMSGETQPSEEQMGAILADSFLGVFFATFWLSFAYGIFRWIRRSEALESPSQEL